MGDKRRKQHPRKFTKKEKLVKPNTNTHHVWPRSRGGTDHKRNLVTIDQRLHARYHTLFANLTPHEILDFLVGYFWGGNWQLVEDALGEKRNEDTARASRIPVHRPALDNGREQAHAS